MANFIDRAKFSCALGGALTTIAGLPKAVPIVHASGGCAAALSNTYNLASGYRGTGYCGGSMIPTSNVTENNIVFGGEKRLEEQIEETIKAIDADLYIVVTGCQVEIIGDDAVGISGKFRDENVIGASTPGFLGNTFKGYDAVLNAIIKEVIEPSSDKEDIGPGHERGLVFQDPTLFPWLTIRDNISYGLKIRHIYRENKQQVEDFIELVGLKGFEKSFPHQLSGGMAQRASLARALVNHPKVLLLDEPLGALDAFTRMNMQDEILRIWKERETTMVMVTHDVDEAIYLSDRIFVMTPRPAKIEQIIAVEIGRNEVLGRKRDSADFLKLRSKILQILDFTGKAQQPEYYL